MYQDVPLDPIGSGLAKAEALAMMPVNSEAGASDRRSSLGGVVTGTGPGRVIVTPQGVVSHFAS